MKRLAAFAAALLAAWALSAAAFATQAAPTPTISPDEIYVAAPQGVPRAAAHTDGALSEVLEPGSTIYFVIEGAVRAQDLTSRYARIFFDDGESTGEDLVGVPAIEYRMLYDADGTRQIGYSYVLALPILPQMPDRDLHAIRARVGLSRQRAGSLTFTANVQSRDAFFDAQTIACKGARCRVEFPADARSVHLAFRGGILFSVELGGQAAAEAGVSYATFTDLSAAYPSASLFCIEWRRAPIFNRVGTLFLPAGEETYLYEVRGRSLVDLTDAYDASAGGFSLQTRRLGAYVIADRPLEEAETADPPTNPLVGALFSNLPQ